MSHKSAMTYEQMSKVVSSVRPMQRIRVEFSDREFQGERECAALTNLVANLAAPAPELSLENSRETDLQRAALQKRFTGSRTYYFRAQRGFKDFGVLRRACAEGVVNRLWKA